VGSRFTKRLLPAVVRAVAPVLNIVPVAGPLLSMAATTWAGGVQARQAETDQKNAIKAQQQAMQAAAPVMAGLPMPAQPQLEAAGGPLPMFPMMGPQAGARFPFPQTAPFPQIQAQASGLPPGITQAEYDGAWEVLSSIAKGYSDSMVRAKARKAKVGKRVILECLPYMYSLDISEAAGLQEWVLTGSDKRNLSDEVERILRPRKRGIISKGLLRAINQMRFIRKAIQAVGGGFVKAPKRNR